MGWGGKGLGIIEGFAGVDIDIDQSTRMPATNDIPRPITTPQLES